MSCEKQVYTPNVSWYQTKNNVYINFEVSDTKNNNIIINENNISFSAESNGTNYDMSFEFYNSINKDNSSFTITDKNVKVNLEKKEDEKWLYLTNFVFSPPIFRMAVPANLFAEYTYLAIPIKKQIPTQIFKGLQICQENGIQCIPGNDIRLPNCTNTKWTDQNINTKDIRLAIMSQTQKKKKKLVCSKIIMRKYTYLKL